MLYRGLRLQAQREKQRHYWTGSPIVYQIVDPRDGTVLVAGHREGPWHISEVITDLRALVDVVKLGLLKEQNEQD